MIYFIGKVLGLVALAGIAGSILNFCSKLLSKSLRNKENVHPLVKSFSQLCTAVFVKNHRLWGGLAVLGMLSHATIQFINYGFVWSGSLAAIVLCVQGYLGYSISKKPTKQKYMLHRGVALLMVIALATHWLHVEFF